MIASGWRILALAGLVTIPLCAAGGTQERSCWLRDAAAPGKGLVLTLCEQGAVWVSADNGANWVKRDTNSTEKQRAMAFLDAKRGFIVGDHGLMLATADAGLTWAPRQLDIKDHLMDITFVGESGWVAGYQGTVLHTSDGGRTWTRQETHTTQTLENIFFLDQDHGWVVGWSGTILRTVDGGQHWEVIHADAASWSLTALYFRDATNGWMAGFAGQILRSRDGGKTWQVQQSPVKSWLGSVAFDRDGRGWITYDDGLLVSEDGGETWKDAPVGRRYFLSKLALVDNSLWAIGQSTVLRQSGLKWSRIESLVPGGMAPAATATRPAGPRAQ